MNFINYKKLLIEINKDDVWPKEIEYKTTTTKNKNGSFRRIRVGSESLLITLAEAFKFNKKPKSANAGILKLSKLSFEKWGKQRSLKYILPELNKIIQKLHPDNISTLNQQYTKFRNTIKAVFGLNSKQYIMASNTKVFGITPEQVNLDREQAQSRLEYAHNNVVEIDPVLIYKVIDDIKDSDDLYDNLICCGLACGSRLIELLRISKYFDINDVQIEVLGVAKDKTIRDTGKPSTRSIKKPLVGLKVSKFLKLINQIRSNDIIDLSIDNSTQSSRVNTKLNAKMKLLLPGLKFHDCRRVYGSLSYETFGKAQNITKVLWLNRVLGHASGIGNPATMAYSAVKLKPVDLDDIKLKMSELADQGKALDDKFDKLFKALSLK